ncbi:MAG TPA: oligosaccharide flippase family protein [Pirellulaceae bacterium]|nr:oligosaccharide flippase family protein [Pirellulaceae bacterium]
MSDEIQDASSASAGAPATAEAGDLVGAVRRGTRWVFYAQIASQLVSLGVLAVMYRLVKPEEYGLFAAALPAVMLPRMAATLGLSTAVLQEPELSHEQKSGLFWLSVVLGLAAAAVTAVCGPLLAAAYNQPPLAEICLALAGATIIAVLGNQHLALLERELKLREASAARLVALVSGGLAGVLTARRGAGVWALVAQQYAELAVLTVWVWMLEPWRPGWPGPAARLRQFVAFSTSYSLSQLVNYAALNLDKIVIPLALGAAGERVLGLYSQAQNLMMRPVSVLTSPLTGVMVAGLAKARDDQALRTELAAKFFRLAGVGLLPCAVGLAVVAPDVMLVLGGQRWSEAGMLLAVLAPAIVAHGLNNLAAYVLSSAGRAGYLLLAMLLLLLLLVQGMLAGLFFGRTFLAGSTADAALAPALGMAIAQTAAVTLVWLGPYLWFCLRTAQLDDATVLRVLLPPLRAALLMGAVVWLLRLMLIQTPSISPAVRLLALIGAGVLSYALLAQRDVRWAIGELTVERGATPAATP